MKKRLSGCGVFSSCGVIFCSFLFLASSPISASAVQLFATSYEMQNGDYSTPGTSLMDDTYSIPTWRTTPYAQLTGGLGELTDGIAATSNWDIAPSPYVGWSQHYLSSPTIVFNFADTVLISDFRISMNTGYNSASVTFSMPGETPITEPISGNYSGLGANTWYGFTSIFLTGNTFTLTLNDRPPDTLARDWILISEVEFYGSPVNPPAVPEPATMLLFGTGLAGLAGVARRKKKA